jgi:hypothetical protein
VDVPERGKLDKKIKLEAKVKTFLNILGGLFLLIGIG